jgi:hypothetical protein
MVIMLVMDYNNKVEEYIKNSVNLGYYEGFDLLERLFNTKKNIIFKTEQKIKKKIESIKRFGDIILSIDCCKPFKIKCNGLYITPWIKSTKEHNITIPFVSLDLCSLYIKTESDKVIFEYILLQPEERELLRYNSYMLNTYSNNFIINGGYMINITNNNIWNCKKSHLKKTEKYQKIYKSLFENTKLSPDIINLIIEQQYIIVDPGICTCSGT